MELSILNTLPLAEKLILSLIISHGSPYLKNLLQIQHHVYQDSLLHVSEYDVELHCQPGSRMKLSDVLSRQSNHSIDADNKTEIMGLNVSIHEIDTDISE